MYGSLAGADTYFAEVGIDGLWETYTDSQKTKALNLATKQIDRLPLIGQRYDIDQDNEFPRFFENGVIEGMYFSLPPNSDQVQVPEDVIEATYIQAKFSLDNLGSPRINAQRQGVTSITVGRTSESYNSDNLAIDRQYQFGTEAMSLLEKFLKIGW